MNLLLFYTQFSLKQSIISFWKFFFVCIPGIGYVEPYQVASIVFMNKQMQVIGFDDKKYARTGFPQIIESKIP